MPTTPEGSSSPIEPGYQLVRRELDHVVERMKNLHEQGASAFEFELALDKAGLLSQLEEAGIIPPDECPNPYNLELEEELSNKWWDEHPEEAGRYVSNMTKREERIRYLYFGALLAAHFSKK